MNETPEHTIAALCRRSDEISRKAGWVDDANPRPYETGCNLMHSELSEALEDFRKHKNLDEIYYEYTHNGGTTTLTNADALRIREENPALVKPCGIPMELADFVIRICQEAGTSGFSQQLHAEHAAATQLDASFSGDFNRYLARAHGWISKSLESQNASFKVTALGIALRSTFVFCEKNNIDLWAAVDEKEAFNRTRAFRHGGKKV